MNIGSLDADLVIWLNGLSGNVKIFDDLMRVIASDYLVPLVFSLCLLALWFSGRNPVERAKYPLATLVGAGALGLSNGAVMLINDNWARPRPFVDHGDQLNLLFYPPPDPSFPANPVAIGVAAAAAVWTVNRKFGWWMFAAASLYGFSRLYAGVFYPTDIVVGSVVGVAVFILTNYLRRFLEPLVSTTVRFIHGLSAA